MSLNNKIMAYSVQCLSCSPAHHHHHHQVDHYNMENDTILKFLVKTSLLVERKLAVDDCTTGSISTTVNARGFLASYETSARERERERGRPYCNIINKFV